MATWTNTATAVRFHLSLTVSDLAKALEFYRALLGREPAKCRPDYAKFELNEPPLVLSLEPNQAGAGGALNHTGFRLPDSAALVEVQRRLEAAGIATKRLEGVECCYARQTKFWVTDPDRTLWEVYVLEEDIDHRGAGQTLPEMLPDAAGVREPVVWEHCMGQPVPERIPLADGAADEVRLRGSFNLLLSEAAGRRLLAEARRVLAPGGEVLLHVLTADQPLPGPLSLPGPAAAVRHVPVQTEPVRALEAAGFVAVQLTKLADAPCFERDGVEMRETKITGRKPADAAAGGQRVVVYKGPFREATEDLGNTYRRGQRTAVDGRTWAALRPGPLAEQFAFLTPGAGGCGT